jgi:hypothetical protein
VLVAAGDIAPDPFRPDLGGLDDLATAALVEGISPDRVAPLGDNQYEYGRLYAFQHPEGFRLMGPPGHLRPELSGCRQPPQPRA